MANRPNKTLLGVTLLLGVLAIAVGGWLVVSKVTDPFRTASSLDIPAYVSSSKSLRGNTYKVAGEVQVLLAWSPSGRIISVGIGGGQRTIPILLPKEFNSMNIEKGQKLHFLLVVDESGVLRATRLAKS